MSELSVTRPIALLFAVSAVLALAGCDTQSGAPPQGEAATRNAASTDGEVRQGEHGTYRIDRSRAGEALPATTVRAPDGSLRPLTSLAGRPVVLNLWATWCAPCVVELPTLEALAQRTGDAAQIVLLSQDLSEADVPTAFLAERNVRIAQNWHDPENAVGLSAGGNLPTTIIYDAEGKEVLRVIGPLDWAGGEAATLLREAGI